MLIDAHAHLDQYPDGLLTSVLHEIAARRILTVSTAMDLPSYQRTKALAARSRFVLPTFGIHPWKAPAYASRLDELASAIAESPMLGEIGLDYRYVDDRVQFPAQRCVFELFLAAARDQQKIVNLHTAGAERDVLELLRGHEISRAIIHWYSGPQQLVPAFVNQGAFFTIGVEVLSSPQMQALAREIPHDRLLIETDNPDGLAWLTGVAGMPVHLVKVVGRLAELLHTTETDVTQTVEANFARLIQDDPWLSDVNRMLREESCKTPAQHAGP